MEIGCAIGSVTINNTTHQAAFNTGNQLISFNGQALTYDANGNRLSDAKYNYARDQADRLVGVTKNGENQPFVTYTYDEDNRRLSKKINGQITNYHYDGDSIDVLYETDTNGQVLRHYIYSDDNIRLAMKSGKNTVYYHYNGHGDVVALTDENGQQVASYTYDAWGKVLTSEAKTELAKSNPYGYAGYTYDAEIQQYYLMARYYHPAHGVFTSLDPDPGDEDDPLTMNGYTYADNNPVMYVDLNGHFAIVAGLGIYISAKVIFTGVTMLAGAGIGYYLAKKRPYSKNKRTTKQVPPKGQRGYRGRNRIKTQVENGRTHQKRIYDEKGNPRVDIDYSNHGNAKRHPHVPHKHIWRKGIRDKKGIKIPKHTRK